MEDGQGEIIIELGIGGEGGGREGGREGDGGRGEGGRERERGGGRGGVVVAR